MKPTFKRDLCAAAFGFISFLLGSVYVYFNDDLLPDTRIQFLTVFIGSCLLFGLAILLLLQKSRKR